ncbi:hypothetical protein ARTSIC4J27_940 [Pseudarthrobacter siccitolerans]|uniref:Uncharacterized protein n=1 Tax=Pseudarthrobacter siccitolerans TaxID=861266 RepID=A0A024GZ44_9MICC|nr:hypothetical protein [Pseudarthrobacter siccitolerans]CCQ45008.1 hypothetical protein ARTSIC4J27_940 [Pseudarthrobacter siccitolerans]
MNEVGTNKAGAAGDKEFLHQPIVSRWHDLAEFVTQAKMWECAE